MAAEFAGADALLAAARAARAAGYRHAEAYAPFAVEGLPEALGLRSRGVAGACLIGAMLGALGGFFMQWYAVAVSYPIDIGGRPTFSWPMFVPVSFSLAVLCSAFAGVGMMLWRAGMPRLYHPIFNMPDFDLATRNRFFLALRSDDPAFDAQATRALLLRLAPMRICEVFP
nr:MULTISPECIES: DUF3341 domain-containing protein [unclassified Variovorax]